MGLAFRRWRSALTALAALALVAGVAFGVNVARASAPTSYTIANNVPGFVKHATDQGAVDSSTPITVTVWLQLHNQQALDTLVAHQYAKGDANYHKWLTQADFNANYSPTGQEVNSVENYLHAKKLTVSSVGENNWYVQVDGTVGAVEKAFNVQIDSYSYKGVTYRSNTGNPHVNDPSGAHIAAITGMDNYGFTPDLARAVGPDGETAQGVPLNSSPNGLVFEGQCFGSVDQHTFTSSTATATYTGNSYGASISNTQPGTIAPCGYSAAEMQTAYNMTPLYKAGLQGQGQTIVIVDAYGSSTIRQDAEAFSKLNGLPDLTDQNFHIYGPVGTVNSPRGTGWSSEIHIDVEWAHAMAPKANIALVIAGNNYGDLDEAVNWAVIHHLGNVVSNSWSSVEGLGNPAQFNRDNRILEQAAAQGMDVNFSSGDSGDFTHDYGIKTVGFPGSSPYATSIGGTTLALNSNNTIKWQAGWGENLTAISDKASVGSPPFDPPYNEGFYAGAGGGVSLTFAKPSWQTGVPGTMRQVPDVSLLADPYTGAEVVETIGGQQYVDVWGGTSLACPMFSGVMAIAMQKAGTALGQAAPLMYGLSSSHGTSSAVYDVTPVGSNSNVAGSITDTNGTTQYTANQISGPLDGATTYYSAFYNSPYSTRWFVLTFGTDTSLTTNSGWDDVTGVGTPNGYNFVMSF